MLTPTDILREPPFAAVARHMEITTSTVEKLRPLFTALRDGDSEQLAQYCKEITALEEAADQIKNAVRDHLPGNIKLPVSRRDLLTVVSAQDTISDNALKIVWLLEAREFTVPDVIAEPLLTLIDLITDTVRQAQRLCNEIPVLAETRFKGPHMDEAVSLIATVETQEAACDEQAHKVLRELFRHEEEIGPVSTILWHRLIELLGSLADASKKQANRVRMLLAR